MLKDEYDFYLPVMSAMRSEPSFTEFNIPTLSKTHPHNFKGISASGITLEDTVQFRQRLGQATTMVATPLIGGARAGASQRT